MKTVLLFALWLQGAPEASLTLDEALALAQARPAAATSAAAAEVDLLRRRQRYPSLRAESAVNSSRTLDIFSEGPLELHAATATLALDWPIYDGGARAARLAALEARASRISEGGGERSIDVIDAFADLLLATRQTELLAPAAAAADADAAQAAARLERGDVSILQASERSEVALALRARRLDVDARRIEAAARLSELVGREVSRVDADLDAPPHPAAVSTPMTSEIAETSARVREAEAARRPQVGLTAFTGVGSARSTFRGVESDGSSGVYGVRVMFTLPLFEWETRRQLAEARVLEEEAKRSAMQVAGVRSARKTSLERSAAAAAQRIALLGESLDAARLRLASMQRLVDAGVRTESELSRARLEVVEREAALLAARVERWRFLAIAAGLGSPERTAQ